jgi:hypothetical protein
MSLLFVLIIPFQSHVLKLLVQLVSFIAVGTNIVSLVPDKTCNCNYLLELFLRNISLYLKYKAVCNLLASI